MKTKRFTFTELIAVTLILILLFLVFFPCAFHHRAPQRAKQSNCTANLKQLGNACALYESDNDNLRPGSQPMGMAAFSWDRALALQLGAQFEKHEPTSSFTDDHDARKTLMVFSCPADSQHSGADESDPLKSGKLLCRSYSLNLGEGGETGVNSIDHAILTANIESGAGTVCLVEHHAGATVFGKKNTPGDTSIDIASAEALFNPKAPTHGTKARPRFNALFFDGHVEILDEHFLKDNSCSQMRYEKKVDDEHVE